MRPPAFETHYSSERLQKKLRSLLTTPSVAIEAADGYGKTTTIQEFLSHELPKKASLHWFTAVPEDPAALYQRLALEIATIDSTAGQRLLEIGLPDPGSLGKACDAVRQLACADEAWLVIDNSELLAAFLPMAFLDALLEHQCAAWHVWFISQPLGKEVLLTLASHSVPLVTTADLRLTGGEICEFYARSGVEISAAQAEQAFLLTDGWMAAVCFELRAYREQGRFSEAGAEQLLEHVIWSSLTLEQQSFLLYISPFETISVRQACAVLAVEELPDYATRCLNGPFIRYDDEGGCYRLSWPLSGFLAAKRAERSHDFEQQCLVLAGDVYRLEGNPDAALALYAQARAFDCILAMDLSHFSGLIGIEGMAEVAQAVAEHSSPEDKLKHPFAILSMAWALKSAGHDEQFASLLDELDALFPERGPERADWMLLAGYRAYPDVEKMLPFLKAAERLFKGASSQVVFADMPWAFGSGLQFLEFHHRPGQADCEAGFLEECVGILKRLTNGYGTGADDLFKAELAYLRGDMENAEILAHKAFFLADDQRQTIIQLGAAATLANIAFYKADAARWQNAIGSLERVAATVRIDAAAQSALDGIYGTLAAKFGASIQGSAWMRPDDPDNAFTVSPLYTNALFTQAVTWLRQKEYTQLIGKLEAESAKLKDTSDYAASTYSILLAAGYAALGDQLKASGLLKRALELAMPDDLIMRFVTLFSPLEKLIDELLGTHYPERVEKYLRIKADFSNGKNALQNVVTMHGLDDALTVREREIAVLASEGLRNKEIALRLFVSESTVRTHLRVIFHKLGIDRRAALAERLRS